MSKGSWLRKPASDFSVVFIHGINSDAECWRNKNEAYWPDLVISNSQLANLGVYIFEYQTGINTGDYSLSDIVDFLKEHMRLDGVFTSKTIAFVCHSMGGIVARRLLVNQQTYLQQENIENIGLFLVASPSMGAKYANMVSILSRVIGHTQVDALRFSQENIWLIDLDKDFVNLKESNRLHIIGKELLENESIILPGLIKDTVVEPFSGARYFGDPLKIPGSNHFTIARPESENAIQHRLLSQFLLKLGKDLGKIFRSSTDTSEFGTTNFLAQKDQCIWDITPKSEVFHAYWQSLLKMEIDIDLNCVYTTPNNSEDFFFGLVLQNSKKERLVFVINIEFSDFYLSRWDGNNGFDDIIPPTTCNYIQKQGRNIIGTRILNNQMELFINSRSVGLIEVEPEPRHIGVYVEAHTKGRAVSIIITEFESNGVPAGRELRQFGNQ